MLNTAEPLEGGRTDYLRLKLGELYGAMDRVGDLLPRPMALLATTPK